MTELAGRPGTWGGLALRSGQFIFAAACICVMSSAPGFANYTAFWYFSPAFPLFFWSLDLIRYAGTADLVVIASDIVDAVSMPITCLTCSSCGGVCRWKAEWRLRGISVPF